MQNRKIVWSSIAVVIVILISLIFIVKNKKEITNKIDLDKEQVLSSKDLSKKQKENVNSKEEKNSNSSSKSNVNNQVNKNNQKNNMEQKTAESINMNLVETCQGVKMKTNQGTIEIKFYNEKAPTTVANFCSLAKEGFYDGIRFHRVIKDFMIQAGDPNSKDLAKKNTWGMGGPGYKFKDELPKAGEYKMGSIAMANSGPNTNGSQFFIVSGEAGVGLPPLYTLFGEVVEGMDIVNLIQNVETEGSDRPVNDVIIEGIEVLEK